ncbi:MAG: isopentenyl phosphate kinase [Anaerolineaceae bacterium]|jgi:isopentenyl phosphate kinase|nr:isopentenyl phosphate kinase [Anaerolineaceae bacterium]
MTYGQTLFLKLGGSLITDKGKAETALPGLILSLLADFKRYLEKNPDQKILLGHGSGSFGHHAAVKYNTRAGVYSPAEWQGFRQVWESARKLNQIVLDLGRQAGLELISFPPSAGLLSRHGEVKDWNLAPIERALENGLIPVVYGDVVFDQVLGGTIFSTEELFAHLATRLKPNRILLAGKEAAVYADFPKNQRPIAHIPRTAALESFLQASQNEDVTGGMRSKVTQMQAVCLANPGVSVEIFTASQPGELFEALSGRHSGTIIS